MSVRRDVAGLRVTGDRIRPLVAEHLPEAGDSSARILGSHGVSPISAAALAQIAQGLICQRIETTCRDIFFDLAIPQGTVKLGEPRSKFSEFLEESRRTASSISPIAFILLSLLALTTARNRRVVS